MDNWTSSNLSGQGCSDRTWILFPLTYITLYLIAILLSCIAYTLGLARKRNAQFRRKIKTLLLHLHRLKQLARKLRSGDNLWSRVLISAVLVCNIVYMILAMVRTYHTQIRCFSSAVDNTDLIIELFITPVLILFFVVRLFASDNFLCFWIKLHTLVDMITLPNVFISLYLGQDWLITKTLRFVWLTQLIEVLHFFPIVRSQVTIDAIGLVVRLVAFWLGATGFIHMLETTGDPWKGFSNKQSASFLEYAYFTIVTLSTVGYGDLTATTDVGRAFVTCFIIGGIAFFTFAFPSVVDTVISYYHQTQWRTFDTTRIQRHVLVCGHLTPSVVSDFLKGFLHKDRDDKKTHVLLMDTERPDRKLQTVLRVYYTRAQYIVGSVLNAHDLERAKIHESWEVFILARKNCESPEREDQENLLRLLSIKTTARNIPVTIQVLLSTTKEKVKYIPHTETDTVVCYSELKLGLLAQSCVCPGVSTLISNLFYATGPVSENDSGWQSLYYQGVSGEIYATRLSLSFEGMSFYDAARKCYESMRLILLAVEDKQSNTLYISPSPELHPELRIRASNPDSLEPIMLGYFIGENQTDVDRVSVYTDSVALVGLRTQRSLSLSQRRPTRDRRMQTELQTSSAEKPKVMKKARMADLEECTVHQQSSRHVLVCVVSDDESPTLNLRNFLEPLNRQHSAIKQELIPVTIVSNKVYLEKEWLYISDIPGISLVTGSCLDWNTLSQAGIDSCRACVILTATTSECKNDKLASGKDKGAILCWLMINSHFKQHSSGKRPPVVTLDLNEECNIHFLHSDDTHRPAPHLTKPFACGKVTVPSFFDSVTASSFHSPGVVFLVQQIIACQTNAQCPTRSSFHSYPLRNLSPSLCVHTFEELTLSMLDECKIVVALSRLILESMQHRPDHLQCAELTCERFIVTAPPPGTQLLPCDEILILHEF